MLLFMRSCSSLTSNLDMNNVTTFVRIFCSSAC
jgi:hypothetical protein